ncbi:carbohydrate ABC transporter permease [Fictibacillus sp. KIGAM418]|uniref:Carbohydrate ABC transporter permease n=1 Tax=Fictibacillus marinisediminis TaxID=2878389 RepID=A0A9X1X8C4_9BACL|nr:carbohydrate ABC transporter permease [Fictibacillus marinisediminis]MCK6255982.1 carbohydrate ABC transporter permease [Fictibacillus marinisediminis]
MKKNRLFKLIGLYVALALLALLFLFPLVWMIVSSFKSEAQIFADLQSFKAFVPYTFSLDNYTGVFERIPFIRYLLTSTLYVSVIVLLGLFVNSLAAYAFARMEFKGRDFLFAAVVALIIIPFESILLPLYLIIDEFDWLNTYQALIVPFIANAFNIFMFRQFFLNLPKELEESARMDGASTLRIFFQIVIPLSKPVFITVALLTFITHWGDFMWPLIATTDESVRPLQVGMQFFFHQPPVKYGHVMAALTMATIPLLIIFVFFQKYYVQGIASAGMKN